MTTMYIISAIILAAILTSVVFVIIGKIEHKNRKLNLNWFLLMIIIALASILCMVIIYHAQNDLTTADVQNAYNEGYESGISEERFPSNEEMEEWFSSTKEVIVASNEGGDLGVHIIDSNGDEWVLYADSITTK